jgi:hypothetical protein
MRLINDILYTFHQSTEFQTSLKNILIAQVIFIAENSIQVYNTFGEVLN